MSEYINEKLLEDYPTYISIEQTKTILEQLENCICRIYMNDGGKGTGFFCNIKYKNANKSFPALITNYHVLNENDIKPDKQFKISFYHNKKLENKDIKIGKNRLVYTSKKYDTTIIELKAEKDDIKKFLEIDQRIFEDNSNVLFYGNSAYVLHFPGNKSASVSYGVIKKNENSNYQLIHYCHTEKGSSGGPILSLSDMKVIGIHKGAGLTKCNLGFFLKYPIEELFQNSINLIKDDISELNNQIILKLEIDKSDINQPIYFLDNYINEDKKLDHNNIKELNKANTKLFINEKKYEFQKYFVPSKVGIYTIRLNFNNLMKDCSYIFIIVNQ